MYRRHVNGQLVGKNKQTGLALVVGLVLLVVVTLIAVSGLTNASLQTKAASAASQQHMTFQAAESSVSMMLNRVNNDTDLAPLNQVLNSVGQVEQTNRIASLSDNSLIEAKVTISYMSDNIVPTDYSLNNDEDSTFIYPHYFKIVGKAELASSGAITTVEKGVIYD